jgi:hypothetical protein
LAEYTRNKLLAQQLRMIFSEADDDIKVWSETENPVKNFILCRHS